MFFHFESKQRLKITISTQQATRTSADPFVPDSEYFPHNECICCRHQTWKIRRFVIKIQRMYPGRCATVGHEERIHHMYPVNCPVVDNDKPPSYVSLRHELSGEPSNTGAVAELPAVSLPVELPIQQSEHSSMCTGQAGPEYPNHEYDSVSEHTMHQTLNDGNTFRTSRLPWNLSTQPYSVPASGMISCQQSHNSSPTSVDTTNTNANYCAQFQHDMEFRHSMEVPCETYSPSQDSQVTPTMSEPDFVWHNGYALSFDVSPVEQPPCLSQGSGSGCSTFHNGNHAVYTSSIYSSGSETCIASSDISLEMRSPTKHLVSQRHSGLNGSPGVYDNHEHRRRGPQSECDFKISNAKFVNHSTMRASLSQSPLDSDQSKDQWQSLSTYAELEDHQYPEVVPDSEIREEVDAGTVSCGKCHTIFRGKYRKGNLKRHDLAFHSPLASAVGKACRVCKKVFKRADATKKHEWKKHRLFDAKPKKRNTSQDWTQFV